MRRLNLTVHSFLFLLGCSLFAQSPHFDYDMAVCERILAARPLMIRVANPLRSADDIALRAVVVDSSGTAIWVKMKSAPPGGEFYNNEPRYQMASYVIQKLFLNEEDYVVPPTLIRPFLVDQIRKFTRSWGETFSQTMDVVCVLQYWMNEVSMDVKIDRNRAEKDDEYARRLAHLNVLTYLIRHNDSNRGNVMSAAEGNPPRFFAVDNDVAFAAPASNRGHKWRNLFIRRIPRDVIQRLELITLSDLSQLLGVVSEFRVEYGRLIPQAPSENLNVKKGVRRTESWIQFGLTENEIEDLFNRIQDLLELVDRGKLEVF